MEELYECPYCSSSNTIWRGYRQLKEGRVRIRQCKSCKRRFTPKKQPEYGDQP